MKILMLSKLMNKDGVTHHITKLTQGLINRNIEVTIICGNGNNIENVIKEFPTTKIIDFESKNPVRIFKNLVFLINNLKNNNYDIVHSHWRLTSMYYKISTFFIKRKPSLIWGNHLIPIPSNFFMRKMTFWGDHVIVQSSMSKEYLVNNFKINENKISVIYHGINPDLYTKLSTQEIKNYKRKLSIEDETVILLFGRLSPEKGHSFLLDSIASLKGNWILLFPGEVNNQYKKVLEKKIESLNITKKVKFIPYDSPTNLLSISDLMVLPSYKEGFGIVNLEAFAMSVPVIRTKTGGYDDMKDLVTGIDYGDINKMNDTIKNFLINMKVFDKQIIKAKIDLKEKFTEEIMINSFISMYKRLGNFE